MKRARAAIAALALLTPSCAWIFQDHLPDNYRATYPPRCSTSKGLAVLDGVLGVLHGLTAGAILASDVRTDGDSALLVGNILWTVVHTASAVSGDRWADECRRGQDEWDAREIEEAREIRAERTRERRRPEAPMPSPRPSSMTKPRAPAAERAPRGFYCASSPAQPMLGICARNKDACAHASSVIAAAASDLSKCVLVETAFCFDAGSGDADERCAPTQEACSAQLDRAVADGSRVGDCIETP